MGTTKKETWTPEHVKRARATKVRNAGIRDRVEKLTEKLHERNADRMSISDADREVKSRTTAYRIESGLQMQAGVHLVPMRLHESGKMVECVGNKQRPTAMWVRIQLTELMDNGYLAYGRVVVSVRTPICETALVEFKNEFARWVEEQRRAEMGRRKFEAMRNAPREGGAP